ncbi:MAG: Fur family transcriptional regulator [Thermoleophilia bacterium]
MKHEEAPARRRRLGEQVTVPVDEGERRVRALSEGIRAAGLRLTHQRLEVVRVLTADDTHPDVETIYRKVRTRMPTISLDTVYRTLSTFEDLGLLERVGVAPGPTRYDGNPRPHHHFVCRRCGLVRDLDEDSEQAASANPQTGALDTIESVHVEYRGLCAACAQQAPRTSNPQPNVRKEHH